MHAVFHFDNVIRLSMLPKVVPFPPYCSVALEIAGSSDSSSVFLAGPAIGSAVCSSSQSFACV